MSDAPHYMATPGLPIPGVPKRWDDETMGYVDDEEEIARLRKAKGWYRETHKTAAQPGPGDGAGLGLDVGGALASAFLDVREPDPRWNGGIADTGLRFPPKGFRYAMDPHLCFRPARSPPEEAA